MTLLTGSQTPAEICVDLIEGRQRFRPRVVATNDRGFVHGQDHWCAKLLDRDVDLIHELREAGVKRADIADKFGISVYTVREILCGRRRQHVTMGQKALRPSTKGHTS